MGGPSYWARVDRLSALMFDAWDWNRTHPDLPPLPVTLRQVGRDEQLRHDVLTWFHRKRQGDTMPARDAEDD